MLKAKETYLEKRGAVMAIITSILLIICMAPQVITSYMAEELSGMKWDIFDILFISLSTQEEDVVGFVLAFFMLLIAFAGMLTLSLSLTFIVKKQDKKQLVWISKINLCLIGFYTGMAIVLHFYIRGGMFAEVKDLGDEAVALLSTINISTTVYVPMIVAIVLQSIDAILNAVCISKDDNTDSSILTTSPVRVKNNSGAKSNNTINRSSVDHVKAEINKLNIMLEEGLISEEEYALMKKVAVGTDA